MNHSQLSALIDRTREILTGIADAERVEQSEVKVLALRRAYMLCAHEANHLNGQRARLARVAV